MDEILATFQPNLFADSCVLISGGTSGIGLCLAKAFAHLGAQVTATGASLKRLDAARSDVEARAVRFERLDVRDRRAIDAFVGTFERLDALVNAAGVAKPETEYEEDGFLDVMDVNLNSVMRMSMAARPLLARSKGAIVNFASMLSFVVDDGVPAYCASKTGVIGLTRVLAHRFGPEGIRVNAIAPGYHKTDMTEALWSDPVPAAKIAAKAALKRWGTVEDLIGAVVFLCSPAAKFVTATTLPVDGGYVVSGF